MNMKGFDCDAALRSGVLKINEDAMAHAGSPGTTIFGDVARDTQGKAKLGVLRVGLRPSGINNC